MNSSRRISLRSNKSFVFVPIMLAILVTSSFAVTEAEKLDALSLEIMEAIQAFHPVRATRMGVHHYDHRFTDWSNKSVKTMTGKLDKFERRLHKFKKSSALSPHDRINYRLIKAEADILIQDISRIKWHTFTPQLYSRELIDGVFYLMLPNYVPRAERLVTILGRMKAVPSYLTQARANLRKVSSVNIEIATEQINLAIDFYQAVGAELMNKFPQRADEILKESTTAREAMNDFLIFLSELPSRNEDRIGVGKLNYEYILSNQHFMPYGADSLLEIAEKLLGEIQNDYTEQYSLVMENQNGQDSVFVPSSFSRQDILDYYSWEARQIRAFLTTKNLLTLPQWLEDIRIAEIPGFCRAVIPAMRYQPAGPFDSTSRGVFFVRPVPEEMNPAQLRAKYRYVHRRGMLESLVREGIPGHHLQLQIAAHHPDPIRRWVRNPLMEEGWSRYLEEVVYHQGLYSKENAARYLTIVENSREQVALAIADIKLHTRQLTLDEGVDWLSRTLSADSESGRHYLRRKLLDMVWRPGDALGGAIGKRMLDQMRQIGRDNGGKNFSETDFHDSILAEGSISPYLIQEILGLFPQD